MFCFNEFAFTVQLTDKINRIQILGFILICLYFTTGHFHTCTLQRMQPISLLILGSVFSDCVVRYGDILFANQTAQKALPPTIAKVAVARWRTARVIISLILPDQSQLELLLLRERQTDKRTDRQTPGRCFSLLLRTRPP